MVLYLHHRPLINKILHHGLRQLEKIYLLRQYLKLLVIHQQQLLQLALLLVQFLILNLVTHLRQMVGMELLTLQLNNNWNK